MGPLHMVKVEDARYAGPFRFLTGTEPTGGMPPTYTELNQIADMFGLDRERFVDTAVAVGGLSGMQAKAILKNAEAGRRVAVMATPTTVPPDDL